MSKASRATDDALLAWLHQGHFLPGSRLPPLRQLAQNLGRSRHAVHETVLRLESDGVLTRRSPHILVVAGPAPLVEDLRDGIVVFSAVDGLPPPEARYTGCGPQVFAGMLAAAERAGVRLHTFPPDPDTLDRFDHLLRRQPLGWVFMQDEFQGDPGRQLLAQALASRRPVAIYGDAMSEEEWRDAPWQAVAADHRQGAIDLIGHLAGRGASRLLPVMGPAWSERGHPRFQQQGFRQRLLGYADGARVAGVDLRERLPYLAENQPLCAGSFAEAVMQLSGVVAPDLLRASPADALLGFEDGAAMTLGAAARRLGRQVLTSGYDATWRQRRESAWADPPDASIDQDWPGIGAALVAAVQERHHRPLGAPLRHLVRGRVVAPDRASVRHATRD